MGLIWGVTWANERVRRLEEVAGRIGGLGSVTTSVVYSSPLTGRPITVD